MRFLLDQDVYSVTARFLLGLGHDVITASDLGLARTSDAALLARAMSDTRILVTRDKDFGGLAFVQHRGKGIIFLRITPATIQAVHAELSRVIQTHSEGALLNAFVVVAPGQHRLRRL